MDLPRVVGKHVGVGRGGGGTKPNSTWRSSGDGDGGMGTLDGVLDEREEW